MNVRTAVEADEDAIFMMLLGMAAENSKQPVAPGKALKTVCKVIKEGGAFVVELDGKIIGSVGVGPKSAWFTDYVFLGDYWFYVIPEWRNSRAAVMLKKAAFEYADKADQDIVFAVFSIEDAERKSRFFAKGMTFLGSAFVRETSNGLHML